jgi:hypothetical protein
MLLRTPAVLRGVADMVNAVDPFTTLHATEPSCRPSSCHDRVECGKWFVLDECKCENRDSRLPVASIGTVLQCYWLLYTGYWILGTGYWLLCTGYWVLVITLRLRIGLTSTISVPTPSTMTETAYDETTPAMRRRVMALVKEAKDACHRPLFEDIALGVAQTSSRWHSMQSSSKRSKFTKAPKWETVSSIFRGPCIFH